MFKKVLQSLSKSLSQKAPEAAAPVKQPAAAPTGAGALGKVAKGAPAAAAAPAPAVAKTAEELCEITPKMTKEQVRDRLKLLYRRYNRSASSLDAKLRAEAEMMLNAVVEIREKHFGLI